MRKVHGFGSSLGSGWLSNIKSLLHEKEKFISYLGITISSKYVIFFCKIVCTSCMSSAISLHTNICLRSLEEGGGIVVDRI